VRVTCRECGSTLLGRWAGVENGVNEGLDGQVESDYPVNLEKRRISLGITTSTAADGGGDDGGGGMLGIESGVGGRSVRTFKLDESEPIEFTRGFNERR